jgi:mannose-6-phosphate isomerase-like protein (cupin superfamily)
MSMSNDRPQPVGSYQILQDFENNSISIRVLRMDSDAERIEPHLHYRSAQVYVGLEGRTAVECDGVEYIVEPYDVVPVPVRSLHTARALDGAAIVMNISVPPLAADDQSLSLAAMETPDMRMPSSEGDVDD